MITSEKFAEAVRAEDRKGTLDIASDDDRAWFASHPSRNFRLRAPLKGEVFIYEGDVTRASAVIVRQVKVGVRLRLMVDLSASRPVDDEKTAKRLWERAVVRNPSVAQIAEQLEKI